MRFDIPTVCGTLWLLSLFACPAPIERVVVRTSGGCLTEAPPLPSHVVFAGPPQCPEAFATCLDVSSALTLESNLSAARRWQTEAWLRCGVVADAGQ